MLDLQHRERAPQPEPDGQAQGEVEDLVVGEHRVEAIEERVVEAGVTEDVYEHLDEWHTWPGYTDRQRLAIEYAERFATDHRAIDDELFARLRAQFADDEILDLTLCCAVFLGLGRTLEVLGINDNDDCPLDI